MSTAILEGYGDLIIHDGNTDFTIVKPTPFATNSTKVKRWWRQNYNVVTYEACAIVELLNFYIVISCAQDVQLKMTFNGTNAVTFDVGYDKPGDGNIERILVVPKTEFYNPVNYDDYYYDYSTRELRKNSYGNGAVFDVFLSAALDLNFALNKSLVDSISGNNLVSFTRASSGTFVGADGLIKTTPINFATNSEQVNLWTLNNGTVSSNVTSSPIGDQTADKWIPDSTNNFHFASITGQPNTSSSITYSVYAKAAGYRYLLINTVNGSTSGNAGPVVDLQDGVVVGNHTATYPTIVTNVGNSWYRISITFTGNAGTVRVDHNPLPTSAISAYSGDGTSGVFLWGAQLEKSSTANDYIPTISTISGAPRFDHNPSTGESLGLLIEESSTNRNTKSKSFSVWAVSSGFSLVYDAATAPDGTTSATALDRNGSGLARFEKNFSVGPGGSSTFSVFAKSVNTTTGRYLRLAFNDAQTGERFADFDLVNGTIDVAASNGGNFTNAASRIEEYPNDWYRCSISFSKTSTGSENSLCYKKLYIRQSNNSTDTPSGVTDVGMYVWGGQVEEKPFPTSLIETDGSTVTRAADVAEITGTNFSSFFNPEASTVFVDGNITAGPTGQYALFAIKKSNSNGAFNISRRSAQGSRFNRFNPSGSQDINFNGPTWTDNSFRKLACAMGQTSASFVDSGSLIGTTTTYVKPAASDGLTKLLLGNAERGGFVPYNVHIKRLAYFSTRLDDATLQAITS